MFVVILYSFSLFERNPKKLRSLFVISLSETEILILYLDFRPFSFSLKKSEALKTAGPEIHRCVNKIGQFSP